MIKMVQTVTLKSMKNARTPIAVVTAYDFPSAQCAEQAGADVILVGDSLGMVVLGYDSTIPVTMDDMLHHTKAVTRAVKRCLVVADLPFASYHGSVDVTIANAARLMREGAAKAVKMEGGHEILDSVKACVRAGIPVMGHLGLTPQAVHQLGGYRIQGKEPAQAKQLLDDALALEQAGVFALVLELVPEPLARLIRDRLSIPIIGIGAGRDCDGQVLVFHDLLQYGSPLAPKFVKSFAEIGSSITQAIATYVSEVKQKQFPTADHIFDIDETVIEHLYGTSNREEGDK
jgi:3-methyl-2-oxobutanoate hydroxymethyltransferase